MTYSTKIHTLKKHDFLDFASSVQCKSTYDWIPHFAKTISMLDSKSVIRAKIEYFWDGALKEIEEDTQKKI